MLEATNNY